MKTFMTKNSTKNSNRAIGAILTVAFVVVLFSARGASAHAIVTPKQVGIGSTQDFSLAVPAERDSATIAVRLLIPPGLQEVTPNITPGWTITMKYAPAPAGTSADSSQGDVTEIDWTGGKIPSGQRAEFIFQAQVPAQPGELDWKAYQTYADHIVVSWDQDPSTVPADDDAAIIGPYSVTKIVDDLSQPSAAPASPSSSIPVVALIVALVAFIIAVYGAINQPRQHPPK